MFLDSIPKLPVSEILPELGINLKQNHTVILQAATGAGKTTLVPLYLLQSGFIKGKILMLEPRRIATSAAAARMASLLNEVTGKTVGYRMQMDSQVSSQTQIEVVTEGIFTRMIQTDPELSGIGLIIFDEFHERSLQSDLGLALALQSQELRDHPLKILIMSATIDSKTLAQQLSAPVINSKGFLHPVATHYLHKPLTDRRFHTICQATAAKVKQALSEATGSILVFLPGSGEIRQTYQLLKDSYLPVNIKLYPLFGEMSLEKQRQAIQPPVNNERKIVLATNIAETSLTIEGICIVIDSGLSRRALYNPGTGMNQLVTRRLSRSSADQRKGRAGRLEPGICYRLWTQSEHQQLEASDPPEILEADLTPLALELHAWGCQQPEELFWLDPPVPSRYQQALSLLKQLNALETVDNQGFRITRHGQEMVKPGTHPRIAHMLLLAYSENIYDTGCRLAAILSERDLLRGTKDLSANIHLRLDLFEKGNTSDHDKAGLARAKRLLTQWQRRGSSSTSEHISNHSAARLLLTTWPDRLAKRRGHSTTYLTATGQGAELKPDDPLADYEYLVIPDMGGHTSRRNASVFLACPVDKYLIYEVLTDQIEESEDIFWDSKLKRVTATSCDKLGAITLDRQNISRPAPEKVQAALLGGIRAEGLKALPWDKASLQLKARLCFLGQLNHHLTEPLPDFSDTGLITNINEWLAPYLQGITRLEQLGRLNMSEIIKSRLSWHQLQILDAEAPETWQVPSGSKIRICYDKREEPKLSVRLQELFGLDATPRIGFGEHPLTIELLSPARRPVQITRDLKNFWQKTYLEVKKDLKGRYPKHYWPDDPATAEPTKYTKPRRQ
ncbi:ATP-dependent helicase HrpB [Endozoicomonas sp. Mp262]|uniref:ATP-dependent helicase HrpB n=1 Tax=Endozoicomonas sp. Mp262 TaxID=2919499 RepID=UPI0021D804FF